MKQKKYSLLPLLISAALLAGIYAVRADDGEIENENESTIPATVQTPAKTTQKSTSKTTKQIITIPAKTIVKTVLKDVVLKDSDRDGLFDDQDPYPTIPEIYIVRDDNNNGVVDQYDLL